MKLFTMLITSIKASTFYSKRPKPNAPSWPAVYMHRPVAAQISLKLDIPVLSHPLADPW